MNNKIVLSSILLFPVVQSIKGPKTINSSKVGNLVIH